MITEIHIPSGYRLAYSKSNLSNAVHRTSLNQEIGILNLLTDKWYLMPTDSLGKIAKSILSEGTVYRVKKAVFI